MNKTSLILGFLSLVVAIVLHLLGLGVYQGAIGSLHINIYATWFFALLGGLLIIVSFVNRRAVS